jgi:outer membrane biosynthesis protein TonB
LVQYEQIPKGGNNMAFPCSQNQKMQTFPLLEQQQKGKKRARRCIVLSLALHVVAVVFAWFMLRQESPVIEPKPMIVELVYKPQSPPPTPRIPPKPTEPLPQPKPTPKPPEPRLQLEEEVTEMPKKPKAAAEPLIYKPLQAGEQKEEQNIAGRRSNEIDIRHLRSEQTSEGQNLLPVGADAISYGNLQANNTSTGSNIAGQKTIADPLRLNHLNSGEVSKAPVPIVNIGEPLIKPDLIDKPKTRPKLLNKEKVHPFHPQIPGITKAVVTLQLWVETNGEPGEEIQVLETQIEPKKDEAAIRLFNESALEAAKQFRFLPAFEGDKKVRVPVSIRITFNLERQQEKF